jgi:hypothetical protein
MDEIVEFETASGGLVLLDPDMFDLLGSDFEYRLGIVMDPQGTAHEGFSSEPWPTQWIRAAEPLQALHDEGQFQLILTGEGVFHVRVTDEAHHFRSKSEGSWLCGTLRAEHERLVIAETWPNPEESHDLSVPQGEFQVWLHALAIPPEVTRTVGVFGTSDYPFLALELCRELAPGASTTSFPVRLPLPEDAMEPQSGWMCRATVKRNEGDFFLVDLHKTRRELAGQGRLPVRPGEGLRPGDQVLVRITNRAQGFWNLELDRRL